MFNPLALLLTWRYLRTKDVALLFVTKTAMLGLIISITVLLVVQGVLAGFQQDFNRNVLGLVPHITLIKPHGIDPSLGERLTSKVAGIKTSTSVVQSSGLVSTSSKVHRVQFIGIEPEAMHDFLADQPVSSQPAWSSLSNGDFGILLGIVLAEKLGVDIGDRVLVTFGQASISPLGLMPRQKYFNVVGFAVSHTSLDSMIAYLHKGDARRLMQLNGDTNAIFLKLHDPVNMDFTYFATYSEANDNELMISSWRSMFGALFNFLTHFKNLLFLLISMLVAVATFNLVSSMVMLVQSRRSDIAVLQTLGSGKALVLLSFLGTAWFITLISLVICVGLAWFLALILPSAHELLSVLLGVSLRDGFALHQFSVVLLPMDILNVVWLTLVLVTIGALYPAWRATRLAPSEVLRDE